VSVGLKRYQEFKSLRQLAAADLLAFAQQMFC
jgi:hypothetical protein